MQSNAAESHQEPCEKRAEGVVVAEAWITADLAKEDASGDRMPASGTAVWSLP